MVWKYYFQNKVMSRKLTIFKLEVISILNHSNLKALIIFICIFEVLGPLLSRIKMRLSSRISPICSKLTIPPNEFNIYISLLELLFGPRRRHPWVHRSWPRDFSPKFFGYLLEWISYIPKWFLFLRPRFKIVCFGFMAYQKLLVI